MKRTISCLLIICLLLGIVCIPAFADEVLDDPSAVNGCRGIDSAKPYLGQANLIEKAQSAFLYEVNSQSLLYAWNGDLPQYPASLVKIMTALLVLENTELGNTVTVTQAALDSVSSDAISVDLLPGEQMTVEDLLYCMLVKSANDAAAVLAEYVSGSQESFVSLMNSRAAELGCTGTTYINPHGLHDDKQVTTARDTCRVLLEALKHESFCTFFGTVHYTVPATNLSEERILSTNNFLMNAEDVGIYLDGRVTGGRTGVTTEGYRCIASTAKSGNMDVICIVMGAASTFLEDSNKVEVYGGFPETISLLDLAFDGNETRQIIFQNQILRQQSVLNGDSNVFVAAKDDVYAVLPEHYALNDLVFQYFEAAGSSEAPITKGQTLGSVQVMHGSSCIAQTEVYAANDVPVATSKVGQYIEPQRKNIVWVIILILVVVFVCVLFAVKRIRLKKQKEYDRENVHRRRF